jgi:hypothetical protein
MKSLFEYLMKECEGGATPANTMGMGNPTIDGDTLSEPIGPVAGGRPHGDTRITKRRKRRKKGQPDFDMKGEVHNV